MVSLFSYSIMMGSNTIDVMLIALIANYLSPIYVKAKPIYRTVRCSSGLHMRWAGASTWYAAHRMRHALHLLFFLKNVGSIICWCMVSKFIDFKISIRRVAIFLNFFSLFVWTFLRFFEDKLCFLHFSSILLAIVSLVNPNVWLIWFIHAFWVMSCVFLWSYCRYCKQSFVYLFVHVCNFTSKMSFVMYVCPVECENFPPYVVYSVFSLLYFPWLYKNIFCTLSLFLFYIFFFSFYCLLFLLCFLFFIFFLFTIYDYSF